MKQIIMQSHKTGKVNVINSPVPMCSANRILVRNINSLISVGTERSIIELGRKSLLSKAKSRPDLSKRFISKVKNEGLIKTFKMAMQMLDKPTPLGYSSAGIVEEVGSNVNRFSPGDRVACIGAGYASHAGYISIPENKAILIPDNVTFEEASFGMLGIIAMHGIRCANITFGETVAVIGLGLLGQLSAQILKSYGCQVVGMDLDKSKVELSKKFNIDCAYHSEEEFRNGIDKITNGCGADSVIITAATDSDKPINLSVDIARFRAKIVVVGVADIHPNRNEMWDKEVEIIVSKASGPGIFDPYYENKGIDYPIGYVRWTENRNLEEFLRLIAAGTVDVKSLISHRFEIDNAISIYEKMINGENCNYVGVVLNYPGNVVASNDRKVVLKKQSFDRAEISLGVIGAGLFGKALLLPELKKFSNIKFHMMSTASSANTYHSGMKYGFECCTTNYKDVFKEDEINAVMIITPHSTHFKMVSEALEAGKHVFVEKPLCVNEKELSGITKKYRALSESGKAPYLMVGYNRRFSPHSQKAFSYIKDRRDPIVVNYRINAGYVAPDHWVHSEEEGGSRVIGEICHFVDMMQLLTNSNPESVYANRVRGNNTTSINSDNVVITLKFNDGSIGSIIYTASGDKSFNRELIEIFCEGKTVVINDFKRTDYYYEGKKKTFKTMNQDSGYKNELNHFFNTVKGCNSVGFSPETMFISTQTVFMINKSLETGNLQRITLDA